MSRSESPALPPVGPHDDCPDRSGRETTGMMRHLRLGPPSLPQLHPGHAARRHHGARDDGRGGRGRLGCGRSPQKGRPDRHSLHDHLRQCDQCKRGNFSVCEATNRKKHLAIRCSAIPQLGCSAMPISLAATREDTRITLACASRMRRRSRSRGRRRSSGFPRGRRSGAGCCTAGFSDATRHASRPGTCTGGRVRESTTWPMVI